MIASWFSETVALGACQIHQLRRQSTYMTSSQIHKNCLAAANTVIIEAERNLEIKLSLTLINGDSLNDNFSGTNVMLTKNLGHNESIHITRRNRHWEKTIPANIINLQIEEDQGILLIELKGTLFTYFPIMHAMLSSSLHNRNNLHFLGYLSFEKKKYS